jgi:ACT domain-containing protein
MVEVFDPTSTWGGNEINIIHKGTNRKHSHLIKLLYFLKESMARKK